MSIYIKLATLIDVNGNGETRLISIPCGIIQQQSSFVFAVYFKTLTVIS
jgi:hypothetical protein